MKLRTTSLIALGAGATLALGAPLAASAHVTVTPSSTAAGAYAVMTFSVGHGCDGSPTTALTFTIPDSIESVTPTINPGWAISETEGQVTYTADTPLPDHRRTTFELQVKLPEGEAGDTLAFPALQSCEDGETDWSQIAEEGADEPELPAPTIVLTEADTSGGHGGAATDDAEEGEHAETTATAAAESGSDPLARGLAVGGLALGAAGLVFGLTARRNSEEK